MQVREQLQPAEEALDDAAALMQPMKPQLVELNGLLQDGRDRAQDAHDSADSAQNEAHLVNKVIFSCCTENERFLQVLQSHENTRKDIRFRGRPQTFVTAGTLEEFGRGHNVLHLTT